MAEPTTTNPKMTSDKDQVEKIFKDAIKTRAKELALLEEQKRSKSGKAFQALLDEDGNLIASPDSAKIVQQAYKEVSESGIGKKQTAKTKEKAEVESTLLQAQETRSQVVDARRKYLMSTGLSEAEAEQVASQEYRKEYQQPQASQFGDYSEQKPPLIMLEPVQPVTLQTKEPTIGTAIRPQTFIPKSSEAFQKARIESGDLGGSQPDWKAIKKSLIDGGMQELDAINAVNSYRTAYKVKLSQIGNAQKAWEDTVTDIQNIENVLKDKTKWIKDPNILNQGLNDPYYKAFSPQIKAGEGIAPLNETQREFVREQVRQKRESELAKLREEYKTKPVPPITVKSTLRGALPVTRDRNAEEKEAWLQQELDNRAPKGIYFDEASYKQIIKGEGKDKFGFFETDSPFGTTRETSLGWLLRSAQAPFNAAAATVFPAVGYGLDFANTNAPQDPTFKTEMKEKAAKARPEAYKDSPILLNIAENRGFGGEASKAADVMWGSISPDDTLATNLKTAYIAGAYAADVLDPTLDIIAAGTKGLKGAGQYYKAAKAVKMDNAGLSAIGYGAKEAAKGAAGALPFVDFSPGDVRIEIAAKYSNELSKADELIKAQQSGQNIAQLVADPRFKDSTFAKKVGAEIKSGKTQQDAIDIAMQGDDVIKQVEDMSRSIDNMSQGKAMPGARQKEVARQIGALARDNESIATLLKSVDAAKSGKSTVTDYVKALAQDPKSIDALKMRMINDISLKTVYKSTKDISAFNDLVQLTKNTWANKNEASKIIKRASQSELGKLAQDLRKNATSLEVLSTATSDIEKIKKNVLAPWTGSRIEAYVKLTNEQADIIAKNAAELAKFRTLSQDAANSIIAYAKNDKIVSLPSLRKLIDSQIDTLAEVSNKAVRGRDALLLDNSQQVEKLLEPLETKSWGRDILKDFISKKVSGISNPLKTDVSPGQKEMLRTANQKAANMDIKLRNDMAKILKDPQFQKLYTGQDNIKNLSKQEALALLVVGPEGLDNVDTIKKVIESAISSTIYEGRAKEDIFETLVGANFFRDNSVFNKQGRDILESIIEDIAIKIQKDPKSLWSNIDNAIDAAQSLSRDVFYLKRPESVNKITRIKTDKIPAELQVGSYYRAEAERIALETLQDLVTGPIKKASINLYTNLSEDARSVLNFIKNNNKDAIGQIVAHRIKQNSLGKNVSEMYNIKGQDIAKAFLPDNIAKNLDQIAQDVIGQNSIAEIILEGDDLAKTIAKANGIVEGANSDRIAEAAARFFEDPSLQKQAELLFGEDVYNSIKKQIGEGGNNISKNLQDLISLKYDENEWGAVSRLSKNLVDALENIFYTSVLTLTPRFHGGNIFGAPSVLLNSLGKTGLNSIAQVPASIRILATPEKASNAIAFTDKAGRSYTIAEIQEAAKVLGGRSIYSQFSPNIVTEEAVRLAKDNKTIGDKAKDFAEFLNNIAQKEDLTFRTAVLIDALKNGRSMDEAIKLARKSLYDVGDVTNLEKQSNRFLLFYNFQRNNVVQIAKNLVSIEGLSRLYKYTKAKRSIEGALGNDPAEVSYLPESAQERLLIDAFDIGGNTFVTLGPPDAIMSGLSFLTKLAEGRIVDTIGQMLTPGIKKTFDINSMPDKKKVPAEHIAILPKTVIDAIAGEEVIPQPASPQDISSVNGYVYPLQSEKAQRRYNNFVSGLEWIGISRLMTDYPRIFGAPGTPTEEVGAGKAAYATAMMSPMKILSKEKTALFNTISQTAEGKKMLKDLEKIEKEKPPITPETYKDITFKQEVAAAQAEKTSALANIQSKEKQIAAYGKRAKAILRQRAMSGIIGEDQIDAEAAEIERNIARLEGLQGSDFEKAIEEVNKKLK